MSSGPWAVFTELIKMGRGRGTWLTQLVECLTLDPRVVSSGPILGMEIT